MFIFIIRRSSDIQRHEPSYHCKSSFFQIQKVSWYCHKFDDNTFTCHRNTDNFLFQRCCKSDGITSQIRWVIVTNLTLMFAEKPMRHKVENSTILHDDKKISECTILFIIGNLTQPYFISNVIEFCRQILGSNFVVTHTTLFSISYHYSCILVL